MSILQFLELYAYFNNRGTDGPYPVTLEQLANVWHCTPRNVKFIVRRLSGLGWIQWQAGRGRGHASSITLLAKPDDMLLQEAKSLTERGDVKEAMELINRFGGKSAVKDRFMDWLSEGMGFSTRAVSETLLDTLRFPVFRPILTLDPALVYYAFDCHIAGQLFDTLVEFDSRSGTVKPSIAHSWECSDDARQWTFHLRKGVMFHHGRELAASDVVFSLERLRITPARFSQSWMLQDVDCVEAVDRKTVKIRLLEPNYLFLRCLCVLSTAVLPEEIVRKGETEFAEEPVGTGPFQLVRRDDGICILEAFSSHFRGRPHLDRVEVLIIPEQETGRLKEPDWTSVMISHGDTSPAQKIAGESTDEEWREMETLFSGCSLLVFNQQTTGPHNSPKFRKALHHVIDRSEMIRELGENRVHPAYGFLPSERRRRGFSLSGASSRAEMGLGNGSGEGIGADRSDGAGTANAVSPAPTVIGTALAAGTAQAAKHGREDGNEAAPPLSRADIVALLDECGYRGEPFRLCTLPRHAADALWIRDKCRTFGIHVELRVMTPSELEDPRFTSEQDCKLFEVVLDNEICELEMYLHKGYFQPAFDPPTEQAVKKATASIFREPDENERRRILADIEDLMRQTHSLLFLLHKKGNTSYHSSVRGVTLNSYGWIDFRNIWFHPTYDGNL